MGRKKANFLERILYKTHIKKPNNIFTQEDRDKAMLIRQKRAELKLKMLEIEEAELNKKLNNVNEASPDEIMGKFLNIFLNNMLSKAEGQLAGKKKANPDFSKNPQLPLTAYETITAAEIKNRLAQLDTMQLNWLKRQPEDRLRELAKEHLGVSGHNIETAISVLKEM